MHRSLKQASDDAFRPDDQCAPESAKLRPVMKNKNDASKTQQASIVTMSILAHPKVFFILLSDLDCLVFVDKDVEEPRSSPFIQIAEFRRELLVLFPL